MASAVDAGVGQDDYPVNEPMDASRIIENINATVSARYTLAQPIYVPAANSPLCTACTAIFDVNSSISLPQPPAYVSRKDGEVQHQSLRAVAEAAKLGCHLCVTIYMNLDPSSLRAFQRHLDNVHGRLSVANSGIELSYGLARLIPIARDQARLSFRWLANPRQDQQNGAVYEYKNSRIESRNTLASDSSGTTGRQESELTMDLIIMNPIYAVEPGVRTISHSSTSTASDECFEVAKQWLEDCSFNHMKCSANEGSSPIQKPTYLLDVTLRGPKGAPGVKLIDGQFLDPFTEYVTLSHCWGISRDPNMKRIRLHKKTLAALRQGVACSSLPKTFADAAQATLKLGYNYLWIDALCIMHDSEQAVLDEIANMGRIYGEATLNLAATGATDDTAGLFFNRNVLALQPATVIVSDGFGITSGPYKLLRSTVWDDLVDSSPLTQRSWVFQERCLSKRTLHFTRNELLWECQQMCCSEVFPKGLPVTMKSAAEQDRHANGLESLAPSGMDRDERLAKPSTVKFNKRTHHQKTGNWHVLVEMYTEGRQTYTSDKLLGLSGLARQYLGRNRYRISDYAVGLWRPTMPHSLLWRSQEGAKRPAKYRAPTWTWASVDGSLLMPAPSAASKQTCLEVIDIQLGMKYDDPFGLCESGTIKVRGFMGKGSIRRTQDYWGLCGFSLHCHNPKAGEVKFQNAWFDEKWPRLSDSSQGIMFETLEVYLVPVIDVMDRVEGLILCATMQKGTFKRVGVFEIGNGSGQLGPGVSPEVRGPMQDNWDRFKIVMKGDGEMMNFEDRLVHTNAYAFASDFTYTINII